MEDSPRPDVRALFGGRNPLASRGCGGDGRVGPTHVSYLRGAGVVGGTGAGDTTVATKGGAACPAAGGGTAAAAAARSIAEGGGVVGGGEDGLTRGLKGGLCPPWVFAMAGSGAGEEEWRRKGFSLENFFRQWFEKKYNGG